MSKTIGNPIHQSYLEMIKSYQGGWNAMWAALGLTSRCALENRVYERGGAGAQSLSVHEALQIQAFSGTTLFAEAVAQVSGGVFVKSPDVEVDNEDISLKFTQLVSKLGELAKKWSDATADGVINQTEKTELNKIAHEMQTAILEYLNLSFLVFCEDEKK